MPEPGATRPVIHTRIHRVEPDVVAAFASFGVATVVEALGPTLGPQQTMSRAMRRRTTRLTVAGPAITAANGYADNLMMHAALRIAQAGDILVIACSESPGAQWGELVAHAARERGIVAAITDGAVRDVDAIESLGFPVWAHAVGPQGARKEVLGWVNQPINISGVRVEPGDVVVADGDGVVVVPRTLVTAVSAAAFRRTAREVDIRAASADGRLPGDLTGIYDRLDASDVDVVDEPWRQ